MTTVHSIIRAKERLGLNEKSAEHLIRNAIERGKTVEDYKPGKERTWIEQRCSEGFTASFYNGFCFILNDNQLCITLYSVPGWFGKREHYDGKEKIRKAVKYSRLNTCCLEAC